MSNRAPRPDVVNAALLSPSAQRLVERYRREGRVALHTRARSLVANLGLTLGGFVLLGILTAGVPPAQVGAAWVGWVILGPLLCVLAVGTVRLMVPWNRVVIDQEGLVILGRRLRWDEIEWFTTDAKIHGRTVVQFVTAQVGAAWVGWVILGPLLCVLAVGTVCLMVPWNRVVIDQEGLVILGRRLRWDEIEWFTTDAKIHGRTVVQFVTAQVGETAASTWRHGRWKRFAGDKKNLAPGEIALPFWLSPAAEPLAAALQTILTERRNGAAS